MFESIALWFITSKTGRTIAAIGAAALAIGVAALAVFNQGKQSERTRQDRQSLDNLRTRNRIDDEVGRASADDVDRRLNRWVRPPRE